MAKLNCLFHFICGNPAEFGEHVVQAALGGRRPDRRLLCKPCQTRFSVELDPVLPEQLRMMNARLGVVSDHTGQTAMPVINDELTGERYLVDQSLGFNSTAERFVDTGTSEDGKTKFRRYTVTGKVAQQRLLAKLRKSGVDFKLTNVTTRRYLLTRTMNAPMNLGGEKGMRAVGRLALNVLGATLPALARDPALESVKRWIYEGPNDLDLCHFTHPLPAGVCPTNHFEYGHRVVFGAGPDGDLLARVVFFDAFEFALRMGKVSEAPAALVVIDINPLAERAGDGIDLLRREVDAVGFDRTELGRFFTDQEKLAQRAEAAVDRIFTVGQDRAWKEILTKLVPKLNATRLLEPEMRPPAIREVLDPQLQAVMNLVTAVAPGLGASYRKDGQPLHAMFIEEVLDPNEAEASEEAVHVARLAMAFIEAEFAAKLDEGDVDAVTTRNLLNGASGLYAAGRALFECVNVGMAAIEPAASLEKAVGGEST